MKSDIWEEMASRVGWREAIHQRRGDVDQLVEVVNNLCADFSGPRVSVEIPVGVLSLAVSYIQMMQRRRPDDHGYCQWPVEHAGELGDGTCARTGYGSYLPVCYQHAGALLSAAGDLIENHGHRLSPYVLARWIETLDRAQPFGLDHTLTLRIYEILHGTYRMDPNLVISSEFEQAVESLLESRLENHLQDKWGFENV